MTDKDALQFKAIFIIIAIGIFCNLYIFTDNMDALRETIHIENSNLIQCLGDKTKCEVK